MVKKRKYDESSEEEKYHVGTRLLPEKQPQYLTVFGSTEVITAAKVNEDRDWVSQLSEPPLP